MVAYIKNQANQLLKVQESNLLKMQERNISSYWRRVGERQVYLKAILKKSDQELSLRLLHFLSAEMNIPLSLPENMPKEDDENEEQEEEVFF